MDQDAKWDVIGIDDIAEEFKIPFLSDMIDHNQKVSVNMNHVSGWFQAEGERFYFSPTVEFHPLENKTGFKLLLFDVETDKEGFTTAGVFTFHKSTEEPGYKVYLDDENCIFEQRIKLAPDECDGELELFPKYGVSGRNNDPFKMLDFDPTQ